MATKTAAPEAAEAPEAAATGGRKKLFLIIGVAVLVAGAAAAYFLLFASSASAEKKAPEPGAVLTLEPITLNLADGHFLKLGMALQFTYEAGSGGHGGEPDGSKALDIAIDQLSGREVAELSAAEARHKAKEELVHAVEEAYHHDVMDVYFTEFVMQ